MKMYLILWVPEINLNYIIGVFYSIPNGVHDYHVQPAQSILPKFFIFTQRE